MTANFKVPSFLVRLRAEVKQLIEAICPCLKKPKADEDAPEDTIEIVSVTTMSEKSNLNRSAAAAVAADMDDAVSEFSELSDETYIRYLSDNSSDGPYQTYFDVSDMFPVTEIFEPKHTEDLIFADSTADDSHLAVQNFTGTVFADTEEIPRGPFYEPVALSNIYMENEFGHVHLARFFVFALNGYITMNATIYFNMDKQ